MTSEEKAINGREEQALRNRETRRGVQTGDSKGGAGQAAEPFGRLRIIKKEHGLVGVRGETDEAQEMVGGQLWQTRSLSHEPWLRVE